MLKEFGNIVILEAEGFNEEVEQAIGEEQVKVLKEKFGDKLQEDTIIIRSLLDVGFKHKETGEIILPQVYYGPFTDKEKYEAVDIVLIGVKARVEVEENA